MEQALAGAAHRGVDVRVLLNGGYYSRHETTNATAYRYLASRGVHVRYSPTYFALTHQKTLTVDGRESAIMTLNFDGLYPSTRDYAVLDSQPTDVAAIVAAFDADNAGRRVTASAGTGDLVWSPGAATTVISLIGAATQSIDLENEEMAYPPARTALCGAARHGVTVRVVMTYASEWRGDFTQLRRCGVTVHLYHGQRYYIHAKLLIVDDGRALVSSQNLSTARSSTTGSWGSRCAPGPSSVSSQPTSVPTTAAPGRRRRHRDSGLTKPIDRLAGRSIGERALHVVGEIRMVVGTRLA